MASTDPRGCTEVTLILGGGLVTTELRSLSRIRAYFDYFDYVYPR